MPKLPQKHQRDTPIAISSDASASYSPNVNTFMGGVSVWHWWRTKCVTVRPCVRPWVRSVCVRPAPRSKHGRHHCPLHLLPGHRHAVTPSTTVLPGRRDSLGGCMTALSGRRNPSVVVLTVVNWNTWRKRHTWTRLRNAQHMRREAERLHCHYWHLYCALRTSDLCTQ